MIVWFRLKPLFHNWYFILFPSKDSLHLKAYKREHSALYLNESRSEKLFEKYTRHFRKCLQCKHQGTNMLMLMNILQSIHLRRGSGKDLWIRAPSWPFKGGRPPLKLFGRKTRFSVCVLNNNVIVYCPSLSLLFSRYLK